MPSSHHKVIDFDLEAHKLWKQLNLDHESQKTSKQLASIDPIFKYKTGGTIYVGGAQAAKDLNLLKARKITSIVNTTYEIHGKHRTGEPCAHIDGDSYYYQYDLLSSFFMHRYHA